MILLKEEGETSARRGAPLIAFQKMKAIDHICACVAVVDDYQEEEEPIDEDEEDEEGEAEDEGMEDEDEDDEELQTAFSSDEGESIFCESR